MIGEWVEDFYGSFFLGGEVDVMKAGNGLNLCGWNVTEWGVDGFLGIVMVWFKRTVLPTLCDVRVFFLTRLILDSEVEIH